MPTFCHKPQVASFYSSLKQPYTKFIITLSRFSGRIFKILNKLAKLCWAKGGSRDLHFGENQSFLAYLDLEWLAPINFVNIDMIYELADMN